MSNRAAKVRDVANKRSRTAAYLRESNREEKLEREKRIANAFKKTNLVFEKALAHLKQGVNTFTFDLKQRELHYDVLTKLLLYLDKKFPKIVQEIGKNLNTFIGHVLCALSGIQWLRELKTWNPQGKSSASKIHSLLNHLIGKYQIPKFLYNIFNSIESTKRFFPFFCHLIQGGSMKNARKQGLLKASLTQKMDFLFLKSDSAYDIYKAVRFVQVKSFGGSLKLANCIYSKLNNKHNPLSNDDFWVTVIQWFCNQTMFDYNQIPQIIDWFETKVHDKTFVLKGRTIISVLNDVEQWHKNLNKSKIKHESFEPSGYKKWPYLPTNVDELEKFDYSISGYKITEILSSIDLHKEGKVLHHCVASYVTSILSNRVSIWSFNNDGEKLLTIELNNSQRKIVQIRGSCNRPATFAEISKIKAWANLNNLTISEYV